MTLNNFLNSLKNCVFYGDLIVKNVKLFLDKSH